MYTFLFEKLEKDYCEHRYFPKQVSFRKEVTHKLRMGKLISSRLSIIKHVLESFELLVVWESSVWRPIRVNWKIVQCALWKHCHLVATISSSRHKDLKVPLTLWRTPLIQPHVAKYLACILCLSFIVLFNISNKPLRWWCYFLLQMKPLRIRVIYPGSCFHLFLQDPFIKHDYMISIIPGLEQGHRLWVNSEMTKTQCPYSHSSGNMEMWMLESGLASRTAVYQCSCHFMVHSKRVVRVFWGILGSLQYRMKTVTRKGDFQAKWLTELKCQLNRVPALPFPSNLLLVICYGLENQLRKLIYRVFNMKAKDLRENPRSSLKGVVWALEHRLYYICSGHSWEFLKMSSLWIKARQLRYPVSSEWAALQCSR